MKFLILSVLVHGVVVVVSEYLRGVNVTSATMQSKPWTTRATDIYWGSEKVALKGISWFGFETPDFVVNGIWEHDMDFYFQTMKTLNINAIRIPFSAEWIYYNADLYVDNDNVRADPACQHKKAIEILDMVFDKALQNNMVILLDLHRLHKEYISELWYSPSDDQYPTSVFFATWFWMLDRYMDRPNLMGIDLLNEPHGQATFGSGDPSMDWKLFIEDAVPRIMSRYPERSFLVFVEGINWGHTFADYEYHPINLPPLAMKQIVFSPHVYGNSVVPQTSHDPAVLRSQWDYDFGFLALEHQKALVPGEWGGKTEIDQDWMQTFADYLNARSIASNFLWSLGPNSGDVAGLLLDDWTTLDGFKVGILKQMTPNPTDFSG